MRLASLFVALAVMGLGPFCASAADTPRMGIGNLESQRIEGQNTVFVTGSRPMADQVSVLATVGVDGRVIDVRAESGSEKPDPAPALAAVRMWRFRPQSFEGRRIAAVGSVTIWYMPPEDPLDRSVPLPQSAPADTQISLERGGCLESCPPYQVSISGDGNIRFKSDAPDGSPGAEAWARLFRNGVLLPGVHLAHVDPAAVARLVQKFRDAHFFGLKPSYRASITDQPTYTLTFRAGETSKRVEDYAGGLVGMPALARELEDAVDAVAGTERWVDGNADTIQVLEAEGFDFRSEQAARLAVATIQIAESRSRTRQIEPVIVALLDKGAPLKAVVGAGLNQEDANAGTDQETKAVAGSILAYESAVAGEESLFARLARQGWLSRLSRDRLNRAFASGSGCSPIIAKALVRAGANPRLAGRSGTALTAVRDSWGPCKAADEAQVLRMAHTLIDLGVPLEARDNRGGTALMDASPELSRLLLTRGADPNARTQDGKTALLAAQDDRVALILLRAGADPRVKDEYGSVREHAIERHMPATLAWLDAHGVE
jgi:hypothetical protein